MTTTTPARPREIRYVTVEPGRISLHGIALTEGEYAVLRGIAERMKHLPPVAREKQQDALGALEC